MPKMKSHSGAAKRIKVTGTGRYRRLQQNRAHLLEKKSSARTRRLAGERDFAPGDLARIKRLSID